MAATDFKDYYSILGVQRSADADEIKRAFRRLARKYHPDLNPGDQAAETRFKEINEAYEVLSDSDKRKKYDQFGQYWKQASQGGPGFGGGGGFNDVDFGRFSNFEDFINELLGRFNGPGTQYSSSYSGQPGGRSYSSANYSSQSAATSLDQEAKLKLTLGEAFGGVRKSIKVNGESIDVNIPAGVKEGSKVRLRGKGMASPYGQRGDLYLIIELQAHSFFQLDGDTLNCELPIAPDEAALGAKVEVPTPDGTVTVNIPAGIRSGQTLRLRGKGWQKRGSRGDQLVKVVITVPKSPSEAEQQAYVALQNARSTSPREQLKNLSL